MEQEIAVERLIIEGGPMAKGTRVTIEKIPLNKIKLNKNSRMNIEPDELDGLMQSIREEGLLQPIGVVKNGSGYEICYGNRRFLAVSKLGLATIPAIVHQKNKETDIDIKNLTENIQRRNITLSEIGRYIELLETQGLTPKEIAVRLGVGAHYVKSCSDAWKNIPEEFRDDLEISVNKAGKAGGFRSAPGKIPITVAQDVLSAEKRGLINKKKVNMILRSAKGDKRFQPSKLQKYIAAAAMDKKDPIGEVEDHKLMVVKFFITQDHYDSLKEKYVTEGAFNSVNALMLAILAGKKSVTIDVKK